MGGRSKAVLLRIIVFSLVSLNEIITIMLFTLLNYACLHDDDDDRLKGRKGAVPYSSVCFH